MASIFIKLKTYTKGQSIEIPAFFSAHPDLSDRINNAAKYET
jgi:predicted Zn-dependent protease